MTVVFVHGNPEVAAIWNPLRGELGLESVALSPPGFGAPVPDGFEATSDAYVDWLVGELEALRRTGRPGRPRLGRRTRDAGRHSTAPTWCGG